MTRGIHLILKKKKNTKQVTITFQSLELVIVVIPLKAEIQIGYLDEYETSFTLMESHGITSKEDI